MYKTVFEKNKSSNKNRQNNLFRHNIQLLTHFIQNSNECFFCFHGKKKFYSEFNQIRFLKKKKKTSSATLIWNFVENVGNFLE